jgi:hypothetical protein
MTQSVEHRTNGRYIRNDEGCTNGRNITSLTSSLHLEAVGGGAPHSAVAAADRPDWATPTLTEVCGEEKRWLLKNLAKIPIEPKRKQTPEEFEAEMTARGLDLSLSRRRRKAP